MGTYRATEMGKLKVAFGNNVKVPTNQSYLFSTSVCYDCVPFTITLFIHDVYCYSLLHAQLTVSRSGGRQIPLVSWKKMFTYSVHKSLPPIPILSQTNAAPPPHILFLYSELCPELRILSPLSDQKCLSFLHLTYSCFWCLKLHLG
jgi:hypothetical protein